MTQTCAQCDSAGVVLQTCALCVPHVCHSKTGQSKISAGWSLQTAK